MRTLIRTLWAAAALVVAGGHVFSAAAETGVATFINKSPHAYWITMYTDPNRNSKWTFFCINGTSDPIRTYSTHRTVPIPVIYGHSGWYVLAEQKFNKDDCRGSNRQSGMTFYPYGQASSELR